ncbi:heparinase II/III family protein [Candidatus Bipolaricaulota bacterium]
MKWKTRASLYYHTARHLKLSQIAWRALQKVRPASRTPPSVFRTDIGLSPLLPRVRTAILDRLDQQEAMASVKRTFRGEFRFLNETHAFDGAVDWGIPNASRLWRFHLNYFDFALDLAAAFHRTHDVSYCDRAIGLMTDWIRDAAGSEDAWHPYPVSLRICNWIFSLALIAEDLSSDGQVPGELLNSLYTQAYHLSRNLEIDLRGNHLFENARALYIASKALSCPKGIPWERKAKKLLLAQLSEQIRPDGGHFENSPMYHCAVLAGILDCLLFTPLSDGLMRERLSSIARSMLRFLDRISYEDGTYPLFNDSATNMTISPQVLRRYARAVLGGELTDGSEARSDSVTVDLMIDSGYAILSGHGIRMVVDGGELGPEYQSGHGHCDTLSYELHKGGHPIIVDSGVFGYEKDAMRQYCRSTEAHNTVRLDGQEQSEIWGAFRVARRAKPGRVSTYSGEGFVAFDGSHDGYVRLPERGIHRRRIVLLRDHVVVLDELQGRGVASIESYLHLADGLKADVFEHHAAIAGAKRTVAVVPFGALRLSQSDGWVCREFGKRVRNDVLELKGELKLPVYFGYVLSFTGDVVAPPRVILNTSADGQTLMVIGDRKTTVHFSADDIAVSEGSCD